jgi:hypothetical protein
MSAESVTATATASPPAPAVAAHIGHQDIALGLILALLGVLVIRSLLRISEDRQHVLNLIDLITDPVTGGMSFPRCIAWLGAGVMSWALIAAALNHTMTDAQFVGYGAVLVAPMLAQIFNPRPTPVGTVQDAPGEPPHA